MLVRKFGDGGAAAEFGLSSGGYLVYGANQSTAAGGLIPFSPFLLLQVLLHEEVGDSGFVSLSRLGPSLRDKDLEMEELMLQDETLLGTMQSYMDASLISLIEDFGSLGEQSRLSLEDQNEVSLLTALTEILDNADSENLSPFDSIPDSELLVSPREGSSLHKLLTLSRTPPERDLLTPVDPLGPSTGSNRGSGVSLT
ncbi:Peroxisome proliferator-activated receptor gamma coactivator- protein 1 [Saguinus oedipus]|uniref:Peroxisome proliferator-activated receptor gamma coactivator- protein 1 n=1 Tax=Saguinus oedipus TaxID=9490 RepID=A0ABQ9UQ23_SAGOE|nr:Peroxisome proliferator-activated receptor gamma coactivator- protein 1 [Saguinus oedipus]